MIAHQLRDHVNIVVEGCDCTGKTGLVDRLVDRLGFAKVKYSAPKDAFDAVKQNITAVNHLNSYTGFVYDRAWLGEEVYGPLKRGYDPRGYTHDLELLLKPHTLLVVLTAKPLIVERRFDGQFITVKEIPRVVEAFAREYRESLVPHKLEIDTGFISQDAVYDRVLAWAREVAGSW